MNLAEYVNRQTYGVVTSRVCFVVLPRIPAKALEAIGDVAEHVGKRV